MIYENKGANYYNMTTIYVNDRKHLYNMVMIYEKKQILNLWERYFFLRHVELCIFHSEIIRKKIVL